MPWPPRARRFAGLAGHRDGRHIADQVGQHCRDDTGHWHLIIVAPITPNNSARRNGALGGTDGIEH